MTCQNPTGRRDRDKNRIISQWPAPPSPPRPSLVADDTAFVRDRFRAALENAGHKAIVVKSAAELLARIKADLTSIDLVVLDSAAAVCAGRRPGPVHSEAGQRAAAHPDFQRHDRECRRSARARGALGVAGYLNEYSAGQHILPVARAAPLSRTTSTGASGPRAILGIPVQYRFGNTIAAALTLNLGHGGLAIRTTSPLDAGSKIRVRFRMPGAKRDIDAEGRVAWSDRRVGMGIQFETVDPADQTVIDNFVNAHFFSNRKA